MRRIDTPTAAADLFGPGKAGFRDGNPALALLATRLNAAFFNSVQEEVANVIEHGGGVLNPEDNTQLLTKILALITAAIPGAPASATEAVSGILKLATTALVAAGVNDTTAVTPLKLKQRLDGLVKTRTYYSDEYTWVSGGLVGPPGGTAHGLGGKHDLAILELTCIAADSGFAFGQVLQIIQGYSFQAADGMSITSDATNWSGRWGTSRIASGLNNTSGAIANFGSANWRGRVRLIRWELPA